MVLGKRRFSGFHNARRVKRRGGMRRGFTPRGVHRRAQRRFTRRAGFAVGRTSQSGAVRRSGYNTRRLGLSSYRNKLWEASRFKTHWRSTFTSQVNRATPTTSTLKTVTYAPSWGGNGVTGGPVSNFWEPAGGLQEVGQSTPFGDFVDLTLRGGRRTNRYTNASTSTIRIERWELYRKPIKPGGATEIFNFERGLGWDPSYEPDFQEKYRLGRKFVNDLEPGDTFTIDNKIPISKIDQDIWNAGGQRPWEVTAISSANGDQAIQFQEWHSVSFVGDRVGENP